MVVLRDGIFEGHRQRGRSSSLTVFQGMPSTYLDSFSSQVINVFFTVSLSQAKFSFTRSNRDVGRFTLAITIGTHGPGSFTDIGHGVRVLSYLGSVFFGVRPFGFRGHF